MSTEVTANGVVPATAETNETNGHILSTKSGKVPKIVIHWLENSRAQRLVWLLEELALPYEIKPYKRIDMLAPPELKAIHPLGKSPVITIGDRVLAESGFIFEYLIDRYDTPQTNLKPSDPEHLLQYKYWLHFAEGSLMPPLMVGLFINNIRNANVPFFIKPITSSIANKVHASYLNKTYQGNFTYLENTLIENKKAGNGGYFVGDRLSGADIMMVFPLDAAMGRAEGFNKENYPATWEWLEMMKGREAYKRAAEKTTALEEAMELNA